MPPHILQTTPTHLPIEDDHYCWWPCHGEKIHHYNHHANGDGHHRATATYTSKIQIVVGMPRCRCNGKKRKLKRQNEVVHLTMCDFHNFGLIFARQMHCLPQRLKSTLFENFSNEGCPKGTWSVEKISNNVDFSLWGNRATTTFSSETKIMKIMHSEKCL